jgi:isocitrate lyase
MSSAIFRAGCSRAFLPATRAFATLPTLSLSPPSISAEEAQFKARVQETQAFFDQSRFSALKRPYTAETIASKQGSLPVLPLPSTLLADKLWRLFEERSAEGQPVHTMGAVDPVQMTQMAPHQEVVYISGWACSSLLTTCSNEVGPDIG